MTRISHRPREYWYYPKPVNDIERICHAVNTVGKMGGKEWSACFKGKKDDPKSTQGEFSKLIEKAGLHVHGDAMSGRNWMSAMQNLGLAYPRRKPNGKKIITITPAGKQLKGADQEKMRGVIAYQLQKTQYRNQTITHVPDNMLLNPLYVVLKVIKTTRNLTQEEMAYFVMCVQNHHGIRKAIWNMKLFRKRGTRPRQTNATRKILRDYANRFLRKTFVYAGYLVEEPRNTYQFDPTNITEIDKFLENEPKLKKKWAVTTGDDADDNWNDWFEYYGAVKKWRRTPHGTITGEAIRAQKLLRVIENYQVGDIIPLKKLKRLGLDLGTIVTILQSTNARKSHPLLKTITIEGNDLVILPTEGGLEAGIRFSKVRRFTRLLYSASHSDDSSKFEQDVANTMAQFRTIRPTLKSRPIKVKWRGGKESGSAVEDVTVIGINNKDEGFAMLLDAKSRKNTFSIGSNERRAMRDYYETHQDFMTERRSRRLRPFDCKALVFVTSNFSGNPKAGLAKLKASTTCNGSCIRAENLLYLLDKHLIYPKKLTNDKLLKLFQINREIIKPDIDKLF